MCDTTSDTFGLSLCLSACICSYVSVCVFAWASSCAVLSVFIYSWICHACLSMWQRMFLLRRCVYFSISISVTLLLSTSSSSTYLSPAASTSSSSCHCHPSIPTSSSLLLYHLIHRFLFLLICLAFFLSAANSSVLSAHHSSRWRTGDFCLIQFHYIFFLHSILSSFILPFIPFFFISSLLNPFFIHSFLFVVPLYLYSFPFSFLPFLYFAPTSSYLLYQTNSLFIPSLSSFHSIFTHSIFNSFLFFIPFILHSFLFLIPSFPSFRPSFVPL